MTTLPGSKNPYRPGAASYPSFLAGREQEQRVFRRVLSAAPETPANLRLTGLRGVGKTVLLQQFAKIAEEDGWVPSRAQIEPRHNHEIQLATLIKGLCAEVEKRVSRVVRVRTTMSGLASHAKVTMKASDVELEFSAFGDTAHSKELVEAIFDATKRVVDAGRQGYVIMLDEAQLLSEARDPAGEHPLSMLLAAVNTLQEAGLPLGLVVCGLPTLTSRLLAARTYTERMFRGIEIGSLKAEEAIEAFVRPLDATGRSAAPALVTRVVNEVDGYPFFVQVWGAELWDAATDAGIDVLDVPILDAIEDTIYERLDADFYDARVDALKPSEQDLVMAMADCPYPPLKTSSVQKHSPKSAGNINVLMGRLVEEGVVFRVVKGVYEFTAPRFHDYLKRRKVRLNERGYHS